MSRCHLHLPITDSAGVVFPYASVTLCDPDTGSPITEPIYVQPSGGNPVSQPLFIDPAVIDVWTDNPVRVQVIAVVTNNVRVQLDGVDLLPSPESIVQSPSPLQITGADNVPNTAVLMTSLPGEATFRVTNPMATHEHGGDSAGSVVLTGEEAADFNPYQTWVGYHAGENAAASSTGSSALGPHADIQGASATIAGIGQITTQTSTGIPGDMATVLSSEDGTATQGSTAIGAANLTKQGQNMTVVGSLNGPSSPSSVPDNAVAIGPGNVVGASGVVKIGPNHPTSTAGPNHTTIGNGNTAQNNSLPWAGSQVPVALGANTTVAGDPSTSLSSDDWFGGVGPLAAGVNATTFNPSLAVLAGTAVSQTLLKVNGDVVVNGHRTYSGTSTTLGFYGATGTTRPAITYDANDTNTQLRSVCQALARMGLIYVTDVPIVTESGTHADGTQLEFAETGQALQWKLPSASPAYRAANPFTVASNKVVLNAATAPFPTRGLAALYSCGRADVSVQGRFTYNPTGTNMVANPGFETNTTGWGTWDNSTITRDTTKAKYGLASGRIATTTGSAVFSRTQYGIAGIAVGTTLNWSAYVNPATAANRNVRISIEAADASWNYIGVVNQVEVPAVANTWTRINVTGTTPAGSANIFFVVGYHSADSVTPIPTSDFIWVDAAQVTATSTMQPYVDETGYHPDDRHTGLMFRSYNAQSVVGGQTQAVVTGYMVGRTAVYSMADNAISATVATLSTPISTGDLLQADCSGTSVTIRRNGSSVATFTDSTLNSRVKHGFRVCESTSAYGLQVFPFGF